MSGRNVTGVNWPSLRLTSSDCLCQMVQMIYSSRNSELSVIYLMVTMCHLASEPLQLSTQHPLASEFYFGFQILPAHSLHVPHCEEPFASSSLITQKEKEPMPQWTITSEQFGQFTDHLFSLRHPCATFYGP